MGKAIANYFRQALFAHFIQPLLDKWIAFILGRTETKTETAPSGETAPKAAKASTKAANLAAITGNEVSLQAFDLPRVKAALAEGRRERAALKQDSAPQTGNAPPRPAGRRAVPRFSAASLA